MGFLEHASVQTRSSFSERVWDFVLDGCKANGIAFLPWRPKARGRFASPTPN